MRRLLVSAVVLGLVSCTAPPAPNDPFALAINALFAPPAWPGRLTLSNFSYDRARVEAFATPYPDCYLRTGMVATSFELPLNGTWVIDAPAGSDVCWRRIEPPLAETRPPGAIPPPAPWNRAYTASARIVDARL